jgi:hypothetical protein
MALLASGFVTVTLLVLYPQLGLYIFSLARLLYSLVLAMVYYGYYIKVSSSSHDGSVVLFRTLSHQGSSPLCLVESPLPRRDKVGPLPLSLVADFKCCSGGSWWFRDVPPKLMSLVYVFVKQGFLKFGLTEGERYAYCSFIGTGKPSHRLMMTVLDILTFTQQGVYDVVTNLCALVPRLFFLVCRCSLSWRADVSCSQWKTATTSTLPVSSIETTKWTMQSGENLRFSCDHGILTPLIRIYVDRGGVGAPEDSQDRSPWELGAAFLWASLQHYCA